MEKFYLTSPLYYANARPHVGSAYSTLVCDTIARYKRLCGFDVAYLTGTDEYGQNIERAAATLRITPRELVDRNAAVFLDLWKLLNIQYTHFIRTTVPDHARSVQRLVRRAQEAGLVYKARYQGRYCVYDNLYVSDSTDPADCPTCGRPAELMSEENYFFKLSALQERLLEHYEKHPEFIQPDFRRNEVVSFVKSGLRDISISRKTVKWGVPWPGDPDHVVYVWYDALTGYLTGIGFAEGKEGSGDSRKYWPADLHMMAKEIIRFHAVYWPAFLMAANLPLPKTIFAHGWLLFEQDKMSKSKGNVVYCEPIIEVLGADALRYYLLRDVPFGQDASFSYAGLLQRFNSDLANDLGNLANRTLVMVDRYFDGKLLSAEDLKDEEEYAIREISDLASKTLGEFRARFDAYDFSRALEAVWKLIARVNKYLVDTHPWALAEADLEANRSRLGAILYTAAEAVRFSAALLYPVIPHGAERLWAQFGGTGKLEDQRLDDLRWGELRAGARLAKPEIIFPRLDKEAVLRRLRKLEETAREGATPRKETAKTVDEQTTPKISIDDFAKVEMRVGEIRSAERVPGAQKLLTLRVDIGTEVRQVVAGIAEVYQPEQLVGMKVVVVTNLEPRKLRGVESNGMVVAATVGEEGRPVLVTFKEDVPNGARLK